MKIRLRIRPRGTTDDGDGDAKRLKGDDTTDRLSELPDSLILEILSLLPMRDIVRTSVLSKRWKDVWITLPFFNFKEIWKGKPQEFFSSPSFKSIHQQLKSKSSSLRKVEIVVTWNLNDVSLYDFIQFLMKDGRSIEKIVVKGIGNKRLARTQDLGLIAKKILRPLTKRSPSRTCLRSVVFGDAKIIFKS